MANIGKEPENRTVIITDEGKWVYTPDNGFIGRDEFSIVITNPDGTKNQYFFVVDVEDPLLGRTPDIDESGKDRGDVLPETGINNRGFSIIIGLLLICAGLKYFLRDIGTNGTN